MKRDADKLVQDIIAAVTGGQAADGHAAGEVFLRALGSALSGATMEQRGRVQALCRQIMGAACNVEYDIAANGEQALITKVCGDGDVVFDVGANQGAWTRAVLDAAPNASVHCFELIPQTAKALAQTLHGLPNVKVNACGLADAPGDTEAFFVEARSELSGLFCLHGNHEPARVKCRLTTGDLYAERLRIERIRLLKVDCEGYDYNVLEGFRTLLRQKRIDVVQFEYGYANIAARRLLADFYDRLGGLGYALGKLYPDGVDFKAYDVADENFLGPNYVACRASDAALMTRLRRF